MEKGQGDRRREIDERRREMEQRQRALRDRHAVSKQWAEI
jgi:hypothetical protein